VLKNSVFQRYWSVWQIDIPRNDYFANSVYKTAFLENDVLNFRDEFSIEEFFNNIGSLRTLAARCIKVCVADKLSFWRGAPMAAKDK